MQLGEYLRSASGDLVRHKLRTLLTMLGIIFGVGAVISMLSIGAGAQAEALELIDSMGLRNIIVRERPMENEELYDTVADPFEVHDLARDPGYADVVKRMSEALAEWMGRIGDDPLRPETELRESMWPGGVQPTTAAPAVSWADGKVALECPTEGAAIAYQLDGRGYGPDHWLLYTGPFEASPGATVSATAIRVGYTQSGTVDFTVP